MLPGLLTECGAILLRHPFLENVMQQSVARQDSQTTTLQHLIIGQFVYVYTYIYIFFFFHWANSVQLVVALQKLGAQTEMIILFLAFSKIQNCLFSPSEPI